MEGYEPYPEKILPIAAIIHLMLKASSSQQREIPKKRNASFPYAVNPTICPIFNSKTAVFY
jgi:hypothetical protein